MTTQDAMDQMLELVDGTLKTLSSKRDQARALEALLMISYKLIRPIHGDEYVKDWLHAALEDVKNNPTDVEGVLSRLH